MRTISHAPSHGNVFAARFKNGIEMAFANTTAHGAVEILQTKSDEHFLPEICGWVF
jgi:hypothetical protein